MDLAKNRNNKKHNQNFNAEFAEDMKQRNAANTNQANQYANTNNDNK